MPKNASPWRPLQLFSRIPAAPKIHFPHLSATSLFASLSASPAASVGLCNFLSESLPACLHICLPTCFSTSAFRPQRDIIFLSSQKTLLFLPALPASLLGFYTLQYNITPFMIRMECPVFAVFHFSPLPPSLLSFPAPSCAPSLQAGRKAG